MLQDISPRTLDNSYHYLREPKGGDAILVFDGPELFIKEDGPLFPTFAELDKIPEGLTPYLRLDEQYIYCVPGGEAPCAGCKKIRVEFLMHSAPGGEGFAAMTAYQLFCWYRDNAFCGRCGYHTAPGESERSLVCPDCGNVIYPRINPVVIVCVTDGDRVLLTKYAGREYVNYALIAGFCEIGEKPEDTVRREVMEETGVRVKNIRYYDSQPWAASSSMLLGFFAELDGSPEITVDRSELSEAGWHDRASLNLEDDGVSLTRKMILEFQNGRA